jgi:histidinol-phosphate aminotransferase
MTEIALTALAETLPSSVPFVGPETQERVMGQKFRARLGANESVFGPSPIAIAAMRKAAPEVWKYGDPENYDLREALAQHHGIDPSHIIIGEGIDGLLAYLVRLLVEPGEPVVTSAGAYPTFNFHVTGFGGKLHTVPYVNDHEDPESLIAKATEVSAKIIYFANPDNPMGTWHSADVVNGLINSLPKSTLLVLDEAYVELAPAGTAPALLPETPNVIRMRTFSKAYGMAGARVGYAIGPKKLISAFDKVRNHFGMSNISQVGALAALLDQNYFERVLDNVQKSRKHIAEIAQVNGLKALHSATNFVTIDCGQDGNFARALLQRLIADQIFVRMPNISPLDRCIRVSCGDALAMEAFANALPKALKAVQAT